MVAKQLYKTTLPTLKTSDTGVIALNYMEEFKVTHLPILNGEFYLGIISDNDIYNANNPSEAIGNHALSIKIPEIKEQTHIYELLKISSTYGLTTMPVISEKKKYLGSITLSDLLKGFANLAAINQPGGVIVLELEINNYLLSEIAQIVESNDAKILSTHVVSEKKDALSFQLYIKINRTDISPIIKTFERYNYTIKETIFEQPYEDDFKDRYALLMNYINM